MNRLNKRKVIKAIRKDSMNQTETRSSTSKTSTCKPIIVIAIKANIVNIERIIESCTKQPLSMSG